jgi:hypothetical protein
VGPPNHLGSPLPGGSADTGILSQNGLPTAVSLNIDSGVPEVATDISIPPMAFVDGPAHNHSSRTASKSLRQTGIFLKKAATFPRRL